MTASGMHANATAFSNFVTTNVTAGGNSTFNIRSSDAPEHGIEQRNRFMILLIVCFFIFLLCIFTYVVYNHRKKVNEWNKEVIAKQQGEEEGQPIISKKTSLVGQGQKQLIIERKASINGRRTSQGSGYSNNSHQMLNRVRSLNEQPANDSRTTFLQNDGYLPSSKSDNFLACTRNSGFSPSPSSSRIMLPYETFPSNSYLDNVLIRYRDGPHSHSVKGVSDIEESDGFASAESTDSLKSNEKKRRSFTQHYMENGENDYTSISFPVPQTPT